MNEESPRLAKAGLETSASLAGAVVGFGLSGPVGAVVGAVIPPTALYLSDLAQRIVSRQTTRAQELFDSAARLSGHGGTPSFLQRISANERIDASMAFVVRAALETDQQLETAFASLIVDLAESTTVSERDRVELTAQALAGLKSAQVRFLSAIAAFGGNAPATQLATALDIPEHELRFAVRDLEMRGMIKDRGSRPIIWELRELGEQVVGLIQKERTE